MGTRSLTRAARAGGLALFVAFALTGLTGSSGLSSVALSAAGTQPTVAGAAVARRSRAATGLPAGSSVQFVMTSDAHYGLHRADFRGQHDVDAHVVNAALVQAINDLARQRFPDDGGLRAGEMVSSLDFIVEGGDVTNRQEDHDRDHIQPAAVSWSQFEADYLRGLHVPTPTGSEAPLFVVPGNHEASNAVGFYRPMQPATDTGPLVAIFNAMVRPEVALTPATYDYQRDRVFYSRDLNGIHFAFLHVWPDSAMRARLEADLARVPPSTPVVLFTHDQPDAEGKHFINPNGAHDVNAHDQFENLLADTFADGASAAKASAVEQRALEAFLRQHPNITAYFHGNSNWHQAYEWNGPTRTARLHVFRVDSPMKGAVSSTNERELSFAVATIDPRRQALTVREYLWNAEAIAGATRWRDSVTVTIAPGMSAATR